MVGHADIPHHLVELVSLHDRKRILLRLDLAALERVVDLIGWGRDRLRPECRKSVEDHLPRWDADLHPGEIVRFRDRAVDGRDLSHAVIEAGNREKIHALCRHLLADIAAERSIDRLVRLRRRLEGERHLLGLRHRHDRADDAPMSVKNWISPVRSFFSASGSPPAILLFSAYTVASTR